MDEDLKRRGIKYMNVETRLLFAHPYQNFWLRAWHQLTVSHIVVMYSKLRFKTIAKIPLW